MLASGLEASVCASDTPQEIWSRGLAAERDRRLAETGGDVGTPRAQPARRGHITRALLDELRPAVEEIQRGRATTKKGSV